MPQIFDEPRPAQPLHPHADRSADAGVRIHPVIAQRWSARNLDPDAVVTTDELLAAVESARVAASWGGTFPVRFVAGLRGDAAHTVLASLLSDGNKRWAASAGALLLGVVQTANDKGDLPYAMFDAGLATAQLSLQAVSMGLVAHPMSGFDRDEARRALRIPDVFEPLVMIALGHLGTEDDADPRIVERDRAPRRRPALEDMVFGERWGAPFGGPLR
ncbi:nitroreductase family protein [Tomitella gaofuii]|uniref:nitroreductase family protein n=1 Tax=Tomitella gaofuii TaxID=2760083 RepID=UPI002E28F1C5|nr:nitroreductase family protein [Tomitella gaofuii]